MKRFSNGPLPDEFQKDAYFLPDGSEFALPKPAAIEYLKWCERNSVKVTGFDAWLPSSGGPTVVTELSFEGDARATLQEVEKLERLDVVLNIWVVRDAE